jgi:HEAT repeat protein
MSPPQSASIFALAFPLVLASAAFAQQAADPYAEVLGYKIGQPRTAVMAIEAELRAATAAELPAIEDKLLKILQAAEATSDAKDWACRQLRQAGSEKSAAALAGLLGDPQLDTVARWALQGIPGAKVDEVLREALGKLPGEFKAGVLQTIGSRRDRASVAAITPWASDPNAAVAEAALYALGQIGGTEALAAVRQANVPPPVTRYRLHAMLLCAEQLAAADQTAEAAKVYRDAFAQTSDVVIRIGALRGVLLAEKVQAADLAAAALKDDHPKLRLAAAKLVCETGCPKLLGAVLNGLSALPADSAATLLDLVNDPVALPAVLAAASSSDETLRTAAFGALGRIGNAASVPLLLGIAAGSSGPEQAAARQSLQRVRGGEIDAALAATAERGESPLRVEAIRTLAARSAMSAVPLLLKTAEDDDEAVRIESLAALGVLADSQTLPGLVKLLAAAPTAGQRAAAEKAVLAACQRSQDMAAAADTLLAVLPGPNADAHCALLRVMARVPSDRSLEALRAARGNADRAVQDAAIRGLTDWPDARAIADMPDIARTAESLPHRVLALRGLVRMAGLSGGREPVETAKLLGEALALASRSEEKKMALAALGDVPHLAALELAGGCLTDKELEVEAATAVVKIAKRIQRNHPEQSKAAVQKILDVCTEPAARQLADSAWFVVGSLVNVAPQGTASSPDDLEKDGASGGDQAAIDGDPATYWDEENSQGLYRLVVALPQPERIAAISITGYEHHQFAPKDFEILCDGKAVKKIEDAQYEDNLLIVKLDEVTCSTVELKITGYYGQSPAIRELGLYRPQ